MGAGPAHALHFATFEYCRARFANSTHDIVASGAAGACATFAHDALMTPFDGNNNNDNDNRYKLGFHPIAFLL